MADQRQQQQEQQEQALPSQGEQLQQEQQLQNATGSVASPRTYATEDPTVLDPRFDRDDLRQGKPPPAIKHMAHLRKIKVRRPRRHKGKPYKVPGSKGGADRGATTDGEDLEENMTDEEVEVTDEEAEAVTLAEDAGVHDEDEEGKHKKHGLMGKIFGKDNDKDKENH